MKKQSAFTLIELMIAMAIIAILATAGLQAYTGYIKKSRDTARAEIANNLNTAVMSYAASNGGNPPASNETFTQFLASAGETFGGGGVSGSTLVADPVWGKDVCLDAVGTANQPCRFDYTAYTDGTYVISYGVEHVSSTEENFYKTTKSVADPTDPSNPPTAVATKYGVYIWSAPYIGSPSAKYPDATAQTAATTGVDTSYTPAGSSVAIAMADRAFLAKRIDTGTSVLNGGEGSGEGGTKDVHEICTQGSECLSWFCNSVWECSDKTNWSFCENPAECLSGFCAIAIWSGNGTCRSGNAGDPCLDPYECPSWICADGYCYDGVNCSQDNQCLSGFCSGPGWQCTNGAIGDSCMYNSSCSTGFCGNDTCTDWSNGSICNQWFQCTGGYCSGGLCTDLLWGSPCWSAPDDCIDGYCDNENRCSNWATWLSSCFVWSQCSGGYCVGQICGDGSPWSRCYDDAHCQSNSCSILDYPDKVCD